MDKKFLEREKELERWVEFYKDVSSLKFRLLPEISSLAAALLVVGTFNSNLLPLTYGVKWTITILLFLIPVSIFMYLWEANEATRAATKQISKIIPGFDKLGAVSFNELISKNFPIKRKIRVIYPSFVILCLFFFVALFIYHIWVN
jgi:hypothetical protein